jgi:hypothetical protein
MKKNRSDLKIYFINSAYQHIINTEIVYLIYLQNPVLIYSTVHYKLLKFHKKYMISMYSS